MRRRDGSPPVLRLPSREETLAALREARGAVQLVPPILGTCRRRIYKLLHAYDLWSEVDVLRCARVEEEYARPAREREAALRALVPGEDPSAAGRILPCWWGLRRTR